MPDGERDARQRERDDPEAPRPERLVEEDCRADRGQQRVGEEEERHERDRRAREALEERVCDAELEDAERRARRVRRGATAAGHAAGARPRRAPGPRPRNAGRAACTPRRPRRRTASRTCRASRTGRQLPARGRSRREDRAPGDSTFSVPPREAGPAGRAKPGSRRSAQGSRRPPARVMASRASRGKAASRRCTSASTSASRSSPQGRLSRRHSSR